MLSFKFHRIYIITIMVHLSERESSLQFEMSVMKRMKPLKV